MKKTHGPARWMGWGVGMALLGLLVWSCAIGTSDRALAAGPAAGAASKPAGVEEVFQVRSAAFGKEFPVTVAMPAGERKARGMLILLHGAGGGHRDWADHVDLKAVAVRTGRVVVSPTAGENSWWVDYGTANFAETFVVKELPAALRARYAGGIAEGNGHWIAGLSMGGYGALRIGLGHPELFSAVGALSPCIRPSRWPRNWDLTAAMGPAGRRVDLFRPDMVARLSAGGSRPILSILCGRKDLFFKEDLAAHQALLAEKVPHQWLELEGNHNWDFWAPNFARQLEYFQTQVQSPATASRPAP